MSALKKTAWIIGFWGEICLLTHLQHLFSPFIILGVSFLRCASAWECQMRQKLVQSQGNDIKPRSTSRQKCSSNPMPIGRGRTNRWLVPFPPHFFNFAEEFQSPDFVFRSYGGNRKTVHFLFPPFPWKFGKLSYIPSLGHRLA